MRKRREGKGRTAATSTTVFSGLPGWLEWSWEVATVLEAYARESRFTPQRQLNSLPRKSDSRFILSVRTVVPEWGGRWWSGGEERESGCSESPRRDN